MAVFSGSLVSLGAINHTLCVHLFSAGVWKGDTFVEYSYGWFCGFEHFEIGSDWVFAVK